MAETIRFLVGRGIPVMAHVGLTPQSVNAVGGYTVQGRGDGADKVRAMTPRRSPRPAPLRWCSKKSRRRWPARSPQKIAIPTIGIGASPACDGQILVVDDMLGLFTDFRPKFVKRYGELGHAAEAAIAAYADDVRERRFPAPEHTFADTPSPTGTPHERADRPHA